MLTVSFPPYKFTSNVSSLFVCFIWKLFLCKVPIRNIRSDGSVAQSQGNRFSTNPVVVYSKTYCPYCVSVKQLLTNLGATYKVIERDTETDGSGIQSALTRWTDQRTVPNVFIGGKYVGGCDTTTALHGEGKLELLPNLLLEEAQFLYT